MPLSVYGSILGFEKDHIYNSTNGAVLAARLGGYVYSENGHGISWQWNDNSTFDYHNWYIGLGHLNPGNNVAVSTDDGKWYGKSGHDELPFVCEMLS
uniref:C-type lectin domain-containing protein n=1 Tax=Acrobeloides nanus TaxID=290746 RepID=A0A914EGG1_9BILA